MQAAALALLLSISGCGLVSYDSLGSDADGGSVADAGSPATPTVINVPDFSTSSSEPVPVPGSLFTVEPQAGEAWLVLFSAQLSATSTAAAELVYRVDGTEAGLGGAFVLNQSTGPWQHFY
ncbi:MAG: hypothetical protein KJO07_14945, partial [Deltaproteobacteria bacterium]|nr:hypothetical protein [Deltaproteobacteria bacterium]